MSLVSINRQLLIVPILVLDVGQGQYSQSYSYDPVTGNLASKSDVGAYSYLPAKPHAVSQAGAISYAYDQNGNMTSRTVGGVVWYYTYDADGQLTVIRKGSQLISEYGYDGDGKRVWAKDYEGYLATNPKVTTYIGNYYEVQVEGYVQPTGATPTQPCNQAYCAYFPYVANIVQENISYYYADGQRIATKNNGVVSYLYGDQLGSVSAVADSNGNQISKALYHPWGTPRYSQGTNPTDYAYTGQMQEDDIYYYGARWYDPLLGRFMQADTIVPPTQGTQGFDRYAYVNNNPLRYTDPSGNRACDDFYDSGCAVLNPLPEVYNIFVCGIGDGNSCGGTDPGTPLYPYYSWPGENAYFDVDYYQNKANTSTAIEGYLLRLPKTAKLRFIGHSAGADTIVLELNRLRESQSLSRILGTVILDPTLTASPNFIKTGDLSGILTEIILSNTPIFIGTTVYMEETYSINLYIPATNHGGAANYYYDDAIALSHQDLALSVEIANKAWRFLRGNR